MNKVLNVIIAFLFMQQFVFLNSCAAGIDRVELKAVQILCADYSLYDPQVQESDVAIIFSVLVEPSERLTEFKFFTRFEQNRTTHLIPLEVFHSVRQNHQVKASLRLRISDLTNILIDRNELYKEDCRLKELTNIAGKGDLLYSSEDVEAIIPKSHDFFFFVGLLPLSETEMR